jgi:cytoskeletal protein RodZ
MADQQWHPVMPQITDPDLAMPAVTATAAAPSKPAPVTQTTVVEKQSFFQVHKFAIIITVIIVLIALVILYMWFTRKTEPTKATTSAPAAPPPDINLEELNRLRALRRQIKTSDASQQQSPSSQQRPTAHPQSPQKQSVSFEDPVASEPVVRHEPSVARQAASEPAKPVASKDEDDLSALIDELEDEVTAQQ